MNPYRYFFSPVCVYAGFAFLTCSGAAAEIAIPKLSDDRLEIELMAAEPDIVTPIGLAIDSSGSLFVVESHTHEPNENYKGRDSDVVKRFTMRADGTLGPPTVFAEGFRHAMTLAFSPNGELYLVHRNGVIILHDDDKDGQCDRLTEVLRLETTASYPHNGLSGIAFGADGWLYLGTGENLGEDYTLLGSDGSRWKGSGGDGANVFRSRYDGSHVELVARGAWNLFGLEFDRSGNLFAADNDPDGRPPCRLLHIIAGGDYGYRYRLGRHGQHPFQAWEGELPGTLPMTSGTGEAPCSICRLDRAALPKGYQDAMVVTSWGEHQLELYRPMPRGASFASNSEIFVKGGQLFRPVGIATSPSGDIYVTDWVNASYPVHGQGRIWRIRAREGVETVAPLPAPTEWTPNSSQQKMNDLLGDGATEVKQKELLTALASDDPFLRSTAMHRAARPVFRDRVLMATQSEDPALRAGALLALRRSVEDWTGTAGRFLSPTIKVDEREVLVRALRDSSDDVRIIALAWIGEACLTELQSEMEAALTQVPPSPRVFRAYLGATELLADPAASRQGRPVAQTVYEDARGKVLEQFLLDPARPTSVRQLAAAMLSSSHRQRLAPQLIEISFSGDESLRLEAVRGLIDIPGESINDVLKKIANDKSQPERLRAEAVWGLGRRGAGESLRQLLGDPSPSVNLEVQRATSPVNERESESRPETLAQWQAATEMSGDVDTGRRVFFGSQANCSTCHRIQGRGAFVGPDLSQIARSSTREKLVESILEPSREIGPLYAQHLVQSADGRTVAGLWINRGPGQMQLITSKGETISIPEDQIEDHRISDQSLMPTRLEQSLTVADFRDLIAFLLSLK
ncbi:PVC-type heme-binding CxxCH protein [Planctomicrobium sp. SH661]|uniref:PVC-type heme-binding CxxCH protein n=1 Tax=Planctomicrobium sp. SH661 TaxID=3448124 RepID=UPI003F5B0D77